MTRSSAMLASFGSVKTTLGSTNPRVASPDLARRWRPDWMAGGTALELARLGLQVREPHFSTSFWRPIPSTDLVTRSLSIDDACRQPLTAQWPSDPISSEPLSEPARKLKRQQTVKLRKQPMPVSDSTEGVGPATKGHSAPSQSAPFRLRTPYPEAPPPG